MSVYAIAQLWIHDAATYGRYVDRFMGVMKNYKRRVLAADESPVVLEGSWDGSKIVVISFPDEASFREWAKSPEYLEIAEGPEGRGEIGDRAGEGNSGARRGGENVTRGRG
jgi:uncharacterized protein (DUF1330 family)